MLSRDFLLEQTRGREAAPFDRTIDVQVGRLRKKIEADADEPAAHQVGARRRLHPGAAGFTWLTLRRNPPFLLDVPSQGLPSGIEERSVFRSLFIAYPDSLLLVDQSGSIMLANPSAAALLGYAVEELVGLNVDVLVPDSIRPRHASYRAGLRGRSRARGPWARRWSWSRGRRTAARCMVEIALSPLQDRRACRSSMAAIRGIGAYPRVSQALQRARYSEHLAQLGRAGGRHARSAGGAASRCRRSSHRALQVEVAMVVAARQQRPRASRSRRRRPAAPVKSLGSRIAEPPGHAAGFRAVPRRGRSWCEDYRKRASLRRAARAYLPAGLVSALAVPLSDRGR